MDILSSRSSGGQNKRKGTEASAGNFFSFHLIFLAKLRTKVVVSNLKWSCWGQKDGSAVNSTYSSPIGPRCGSQFAGSSNTSNSSSRAPYHCPQASKGSGSVIALSIKPDFFIYARALNSGPCAYASKHFTHWTMSPAQCPLDFPTQPVFSQFGRLKTKGTLLQKLQWSASEETHTPSSGAVPSFRYKWENSCPSASNTCKRPHTFLGWLFTTWWFYFL